MARPNRLPPLRPLVDALDCTVEDLCAFRMEAAAPPKAVMKVGAVPVQGT